MDNICKICGEEFTERAHFWKKHRTKESDYYQKFYESLDLFTGELIPFKSPEQYLTSDFVGKDNLKKYLQSKTKEEGLLYLTNWLNKRKILKGYIYAPSNFELRTLCYPSIKFFHNFYGKNSYENICDEISLDVRYDYNQILEYNNIEPEILIDTREQSVLDIKTNKEIIKLDFGDYSARNNKFNIFIERKSLQDAISSLSSGFDRLCREMQRAKDSNANIIILIESKISNLFGFNHLKYIRSEATPDYILHRIRDLLLKFENVQICCVDGRVKASEFIINLYKLKNDPRKIDFQYMIDNKFI
jgi:hypothetical protein